METLFSLAKEEAPRLSVEQAEQALEQGLALAGGASVSAWSGLLNLNTGIMIGVSALLIGTFALIGIDEGTELRYEQRMVEEYVSETREEMVPISLANKPVAWNESRPEEGAREIPSVAPIAPLAAVVDSPEVKVSEPKVPTLLSGTAKQSIEAKGLFPTDSAKTSGGLFVDAPATPPTPLFPDQNIELDGEVVLPAPPTPDDPEGELREVSFAINSESTMADLKNIMAQAEQAGINMNYEAKVKKNRIKKLHMHLSIKRDGKKQQSHTNIYTGKNGTFTTTIRWRVDSTGKAVDFGKKSNQASSCNSKSS